MVRTAKIISFFLVMSFGFISCVDIDYEPTAVGDALIIAKVTETDTLFGLGLHAYSYDQFSGVKAYYYNDISQKFILTSVEGFNNDFSYETPFAEMIGEIPPSGEYIFEATFPGGEVILITDVLFSDYILPPTIYNCEFDTGLDAVIVSMEQETDAEVLSLKMYNSQDELLFIGENLYESLDNYSFGENTTGWVSDALPENGEECIIEIAAYIFETGLTGSLNLQGIGRVEKTITWGE